ncbi:MAG: hypothetical protein AAGD96_14705 [Chloroflexota bacterium]
MTFKRIGLISIIVLFGTGACWAAWQINLSISTGQAVPVDQYPYHHLTYLKLSPDHGGNFTGNVYLLDLSDSSIVQLTRGGTTGSAKWIYQNQMLVTRRPKGSVVDPFNLNMLNGRLTKTDHSAEVILAYEDQLRSFYSMDRSYAAVEVSDPSNLRTSQFGIVRANGEQSAIIATITTAFSRKPLWVPRSNTVLFETPDSQICLLNPESQETSCRPGVQPAISPSVDPAIMAFLSTAAGGYQVCTATVVSINFEDVACHDQSPRQIVNLSWRP